MKHLLALDCGNSSYRIFLGSYDGQKIEMELLDQQPNYMIQVGSLYYWDILRILEGLKRCLRKTSKDVKIDSIGVCTWGVDFALFSKNGYMLGNPLSYRNGIGAEVLDGISGQDRTQMFDSTGIVCDKINSLYMLLGMKRLMPAVYQAADKLLMIPDILNYMLTGVMQNEPSELSTTQLMDVRTGSVSAEVCERFQLSPQLFCLIGQHGRLVGMLADEIREELAIEYPIPVVCVPSHDTASAVLAVPAAQEDFAFISSGTWSLIGTEVRKPIVTREAMQCNLTNEMGAFGRITLLKNNAGMFLMQRVRSEYQEATQTKVTWEQLLEIAENAKIIATFDVNGSKFFQPVSMSGAIWEDLLESGQVSGRLCWDVVVRSVYESLSSSYAQCIQSLERVTNKRFQTIYVVGGGSRDSLMNRLTAEKTNRTIVTCDSESTTLGNIAAQIAYFEPQSTPEKLREIVRHSVTTRVFQ